MNSSATPTPQGWVVRKRTSIAFVLTLLMVSALLFVHHSWPEEAFIDFTLDGAGFALVVLGVLGRLWCTLYIGGKKHEELQITGPYSVVRHPLYASNLLLALGFSALTENPVILGVVLAYFAFQYVATIRYEEMALCMTFGDAYREYQRTVPCFLPTFRRVDLQAPESVNMLALKKEIVRVLIFLAFIPLLELVSLLHEKGILPFIQFP